MRLNVVQKMAHFPGFESTLCINKLVISAAGEEFEDYTPLWSKMRVFIT